MKTLLALLLSLFLIASLVACGPDETPDNGGGTENDGGGTENDGGGTENDGGETDDSTDYGPAEDPAVPDIDWELPV